MNNKRGFTLIELLVVIAIIAILAAILFPVFLSVRQKALETKCASNLKQIGVCFEQYIADWGGHYPLYGPYGWVKALEKYSKTRRIGRCPADGDYDPKMPDVTKRMVDYWRNAYTDYWTRYNGTGPAPHESSIVYRKTTVLLQDGPPTGIRSDDDAKWILGGHNTWWGPPTTWTNPDNYELCYKSERRHNGGANVLFCDYHVKLVRPEEFKSDRINTYEDNPFKVGPPWGNRNDGRHPWYRPD